MATRLGSAEWNGHSILVEHDMGFFRGDRIRLLVDNQVVDSLNKVATFQTHYLRSAVERTPITVEVKSIAVAPFKLDVGGEELPLTWDAPLPHDG